METYNSQKGYESKIRDYQTFNGVGGVGVARKLLAGKFNTRVEELEDRIAP
ncbi:MAG: hypothetical protein WC438_02320 [Candidatus Pacearchaeota archaeon]